MRKYPRSEQRPCPLCGRLVRSHNWNRAALCSHKCPHGRSCSDIDVKGAPDCDECRNVTAHVPAVPPLPVVP